MKRSVRTSALLFLVAVSVAELGCKTTPIEPDTEPEQAETGPEPVGSIPDRFMGSWRWLMSCGGFAGQCFGPDSGGIAHRLNLKETGDFEVLVADTIWEAGTFSIVLENAGYMIRYEPNRGLWYGRHWIRLSGPDTLMLDDGCCDLFSHTYARMAAGS